MEKETIFVTSDGEEAVALGRAVMKHFQLQYTVKALEDGEGFCVVVEIPAHPWINYVSCKANLEIFLHGFLAASSRSDFVDETMRKRTA